ncbi:arylsulfatase [Maribacter algarum]|uniref:Arylsulfatase n=1 Tax=Maribacter algarum (ex Zhang et al. 2020) TaxID=2578118 RepID=A0A5S3PS96_9FLAO|nr:arylsulfatase [Maribacter algarum]TMM56773.1 arylsulfatase [Maribacter algarum]
MTKTRLLKPFLFLFSLLLLSCGEKKTEIQNKTTETSKKPNIIVIVTDDQGYGDLGYHGNPIVKTPHLDAFAKESMELTNFHVGTTCAPTRAGIMTGRNANRNNAWHTIAGCSILLEDEETMAEVFLRNSYQTAMLGKWHLGDNYPFRPHDRGFQEAFYHGGGGVQQTPDYWNNNYFDDTYFRNGVPEKTKGYCTDVWFDEAIDYTKERKDEPFFMYLALNAAHGPFNVPEKYEQMYASTPLTAIQKRFYGMVSNIDDNFGRLVSHLKETDQFDNTILIFTTDNGTARGIATLKESGEVLGYNSGLRGTKGSHYDGGHKVPFFISWPNGNIQQKGKSNDLVAHVDLLPTLAELANLPYTSKKPLDGKSMAATLKGEEKDSERMLVVDTQRNQLPEKGRNPSVMQGEWRLVNGKELYNTLEDVGQQNDIAEKYPDQVKKMQEFYDTWWKSIESDIRYAEIPVGEEAANPVLITIHDMHTADNLPWNQVQIRKGEAHPNGFYSINVVEDGAYQFKLYRYSPESRLGLNTSVEKIEGTSFMDGLPEGKTLKIDTGFIQIGNSRFKSDAHTSDNFIVVKANLSKGSYELKSNFLTQDGTELSAYYTEIEKL